MKEGTTSKRRQHLTVRNALKNAAAVISHRPYFRPLSVFELEKQYYNLLYRRRQEGLANRIRMLSMRITDQCNLHCHSCGQWGDSGYLHDKSLKDLRKTQVPKERYVELFRDLKASGHQPILYFWGGEPMLYDGLMDLIEEGARLGMPPTIGTNGTHVAARAERMVEAPMFMVQISVDGGSAEVHNAARPSKAKSSDNFDDIVAGLERLKELKEKRRKRLPLAVTITVVSKQNASHLVEIYDRFKGVTDLQIYCLAYWIDEERAQTHSEDFGRRFGEKARLPFAWVGDWHRFDYEALSHELKRLKARSQEWGGTPVQVVPNLTEPADLREFFTNHSNDFGYDDCISISQAVAVESNGDVSPCTEYHDYVVGNVQQHTVSQLWNSPRYVTFRKSLHNDGLMPVCTRCCGLMSY